ncbi:diguanylate cyclase [Niveibacterium sp. 24ML]|uniref:tetratricopeptide repeat-containing diguanylate cyclase n=1 Tax=Niveibacterium sp. 24ML TaxID=2985512 RepID=UPI00226E6E1A|nr:tetratricopeptide repeat-containing diguanylate cyclase [Niveibacterium sp. 24ML]MCX9158245.1 diguanylate cyclase [Niveibacterium sp. 24ML]
MPQSPRTTLFAALIVLVSLWTTDPALAAESPADLVRKARENIRFDPEASRRNAEAALSALKAQPNADLEASAHLVLCDYQAERDTRAAQAHIDAAAALLPRAQRKGLAASLVICEGQLLEFAGKTRAAMAKYDQAVIFAEGARDGELLGDALYERGYMRALLGEYAEGLIDQRRALALYQKLALNSRARTALNGIAISYNRMGDYAQARHYYEQSLKGHIAEGARREQAVTLYNLGRAHENLAQWDEARKAYENALTLHKELGYARGMAYAYRGLAGVCNAAADIRCAIENLLLAESAAAALPDARLKAQIKLQRGITLRLQKRFAESIAALQDAIAAFNDASSMSELRDAYQAIAAAYAEAGDWKQAYELTAAFKATSDALLHRQLDQRFATLKVEFDSAAKDQENALLLREKNVAERALDQERIVGRLQAAVIALACTLALLLGSLALRHQRASKRMEALAHTDELTGLPNRRDILARLATALSDAGGAPIAIMIADLDHFKPINDQYGHLVGDEILRAIAHVLTDTMRAPACVGRIGGEEFLILLPDSSLTDALAAAERLRTTIAAIDASRWFADRSITASFGLTTAVPGDNVSSLLRRADEALYDAKANGRNRVDARCA